MAEHRESRILPYSAQSIFELVADVERYPDFLPFWRQARVYRQEGNTYYTDQLVGRGPAKQRFRSVTVMEPHRQICVHASEEPFRRLEIRWQFTSIEHDACRVNFSLNAHAKSRLLQRVFDVMLMDTARSIVQAFEDRARRLYGRPRRR